MAPLTLALALFGSLHLVGDDGKPFELRPPQMELTPAIVVNAAATVPVQLNRPDLFLKRDPSPTEGIPPVNGTPMNDTLATSLILAGGAALLTSIVLDWVHHK